MAIATEIRPDVVMTLDVGPDPVANYLKLRGGREGGPLIKCVDGEMTLVSPSGDHEDAALRLNVVVEEVCATLKIRVRGKNSTRYPLPGGRGYEPDHAYYLRDRTDKSSEAGHPGGAMPDFVIEVCNTNPPTKAKKACRRLRIPELWVYDVPRDKFEFFRLRETRRAGGVATYDHVRQSESGVLPLGLGDIKLLLEIPLGNDDNEFRRKVRHFVTTVLVPREKAHKRRRRKTEE
jgi:Uma2 family endonuclease